jgi:uncharacterized membrane protein
VPTDRRLRLAIGALAVVGLAISGYLASVRLMGESPACVIGGSCAAVQSSRYAELAGIPVAVLGLFGYGALLVSALLAGPMAKLLGLLAGLVGVGFSVWLTYVELGVIDAVCPWCVTSAVVVTIAAGLALWRVVLPDPQVVGARGRSR